MNISVKRIKNSKSYSIKISKINFTPLKKSYKAIIKHKNYEIDLSLVLIIYKEQYETGNFDIEDNEYQIKITETQKKGIRLYMKIPLDGKDLDFTVDRKGIFKLKCKASPAIKTLDDYNKIIKRVENREKEKRSQLNVPSIKIYYGGGVSPK